LKSLKKSSLAQRNIENIIECGKHEKMGGKKCLKQKSNTTQQKGRK